MRAANVGPDCNPCSGLVRGCGAVTDTLASRIMSLLDEVEAPGDPPQTARTARSGSSSPMRGMGPICPYLMSWQFQNCRRFRTSLKEPLTFVAAAQRGLSSEDVAGVTRYVPCVTSKFRLKPLCHIKLLSLPKVMIPADANSR